jgi:hypothetical protein
MHSLLSKRRNLVILIDFLCILPRPLEIFLIFLKIRGKIMVCQAKSSRSNSIVTERIITDRKNTLFLIINLGFTLPTSAREKNPTLCEVNQ